jgi:membrane dipeptidase
MASQTMPTAGAPVVAPERTIIDGLMGGVLTQRVIERLQGCGVNAINLTAVRIGATVDECLSDLATVHKIIDRNCHRLQLVRCPNDIHSAKAAGRVGIIIGMQDTEPIARNLYLLRILKEIGVRIIQITHNRQCHVGAGCLDPDGGLSRFGRQMVTEMNRLGLVIDLSHCGPQTTLDAIRWSALPVLVTHANPSALCPSPRNKSDDIIAELGARGGVIGVAAWAPILHRGTRKRPRLSDLADCIDHIIDVAGPDHVGIGSDLCDDLTPTPEVWAPAYGPQGSSPEVTGGLGDWYGFETNMAEGLETIEQMPNAINAVANRYDTTVASKVLGANLLRVFKAVMGS